MDIRSKSDDISVRIGSLLDRLVQTPPPLFATAEDRAAHIARLSREVLPELLTQEEVTRWKAPWEARFNLIAPVSVHRKPLSFEDFYLRIQDLRFEPAMSDREREDVARDDLERRFSILWKQTWDAEVRSACSTRGRFWFDEMQRPRINNLTPREILGEYHEQCMFQKFHKIVCSALEASNSPPRTVTREARTAFMDDIVVQLYPQFQLDEEKHIRGVLEQARLRRWAKLRAVGGGIREFFEMGVSIAFVMAFFGTILILALAIRFLFILCVRQFS